MPQHEDADRSVTRRRRRSGTVPIAQLRPDPSNRRIHPERNATMLRDALTDIGAARSIVIDESDVVLAGGGVVEAAPRAGINRVQIVEADGDTLIAVRRRNLTDEQKRRLAMYDNRTAELSAWNPAQLADDQGAGLDLKPFFSDKEIAALLTAAVDDPKRVARLAVARPADVVWILVAVPLSDWPAQQAAIEQLQRAGVFAGAALRGKDAIKT